VDMSVKDLRDWFWSLDWYQRRIVLAGLAVATALTVVFWRVMIPLVLLAALVAAYLRYSRGKDSL
jgi:hypothetical protein